MTITAQCCLLAALGSSPPYLCLSFQHLALSLCLFLSASSTACLKDALGQVVNVASDSGVLLADLFCSLHWSLLGSPTLSCWPPDRQLFGKRYKLLDRAPGAQQGNVSLVCLRRLIKIQKGACPGVLACFKTPVLKQETSVTGASILPPRAVGDPCQLCPAQAQSRRLGSLPLPLAASARQQEEPPASGMHLTPMGLREMYWGQAGGHQDHLTFCSASQARNWLIFLCGSISCLLN